ncbi:acyl-CoA dehydrogenase family protein [Rhodococcus cercidiphylli]|uniref:Acyl-CoA dehydrogenase family protein n=1 Tax=Rhodococcus cercidiphylli TaxID=489916 RepID=A0ABU4AWJ5_9NOCA|nr:acyl-CoA dehydrogenase family protein [Rhodococcus cercidiphylli]MDV6230610.1 acyl-CoA dehydrogenase family protein [Rhodococcus cercidiphylli]
MHWELSDEQELFSTSLREWTAAKFATDAVRRLCEGDTANVFTAKLVEEGWWGIGYPEANGGQGGGVLEMALAAREYGRAAVPSSLWFAAALAAPLLDEAELGAQSIGESVTVLALRADKVPTVDCLVPVDGKITGTVGHVLGATEAATFLVLVEGPDSPRVARVHARDAELTPDDLLDLSRSTSTVRFDNAPIVDALELDLSAFDRVRDIAAVLTAADALGSAEKMLELAVEYSKQRKQFGQFIGAFQAVKHAAAQMLVTVESSFSIALYAAAAIEDGLADASTTAAVAKAQVTSSVAGLADSALTVHGAIGYTWEHDLQLFYKRAKLDRMLFGSPSVWNERVATALLDSRPV